MRHLPVSLASLCIVAAPVAAEEAAPREVIAAQIEAFRAGDLVTAFGFASPAIRLQFGTPERFGAMVRAGFPMVLRPADVTFLAPKARSGGIRQPVMIRDGEGRLHVLDYEMIRLDGAWKIDAVRPRDGGSV